MADTFFYAVWLACVAYVVWQVMRDLWLLPPELMPHDPRRDDPR